MHTTTRSMALILRPPLPLPLRTGCHYHTSQEQRISAHAKAHKHRERTRSQSSFRHFIARHLYKKEDSYFARSSPVNSPPPMKFGEMWGQGDYSKAFLENLRSAPGFLTPVELFKPHYSVALAKYMVECLDQLPLGEDEPFHLCEVGGGNGNNLCSILDYLKSDHPLLYARTSVTSIDVSSAFVKIQAETLAEHKHMVTIVHSSVFDYTQHHQGVGFVVATELLDNLPHDKLVLNNGTKIVESSVHPCSDLRLKAEGYLFSETHYDLRSPTILAYLEYFANFYGVSPDTLSYSSDSYNEKTSHLLWNKLMFPLMRLSPFSFSFSYVAEAANFWFQTLRSKMVAFAGPVSLNYVQYIPTGSMLFLRKLKRQFPHHGILLADFDELPGAMPGVNAPLVQRTEGDTTEELPTYLTADYGKYDIFFPTNFTNLRILHQQVNSTPLSSSSSTSTSSPTDEEVEEPTTLAPVPGSQVWKTSSFMSTYANLAHTRTRSGYNPLVSDFSNTSIFAVAPRPILRD